MAGTPPRPTLDDFVCFPLYAASRAVTRAYAGLLDEHDLTYPQYLVLTALGEREEPVSLTWLGGRLHLDSGTLTPLLKRLEGAGAVSRRRDPHDERRLLVALTERGRELYDAVADVPGRLAAGSGMSAEELDALRGQLFRLVERVSPAGPASSPGSSAR